jgi:FkbM family methyltransferase
MDAAQRSVRRPRLPVSQQQGTPMESWLERLATLPLPPRPVVVDGGANKGAVTDRFLTALPGCRVEAFEPLPRLARKLARRFGDEPRVTVHAMALGEAPATLPLSVLSRPTLSSLRPPTGIRDKYVGEDLPVTETVDVPVVRLDAVVARADVLKLDVQGYELPALRGAAGLLPGLTAVVAEVARYPLYAGQESLADLEAYLADFGLRLFGLFDPFRDATGRIVSGDALFLAS